MNERLHIVCLDAPAPPNYGGAIDMYYKIIALASIGHQVCLHYFHYSDKRNADQLIPYCREIYSYKRAKGISSLSFPLPYIVSSRINKELIERLNKDDAPIILEGIHCTGIIPFIINKQRKIVIRVHNDEATYYKRLAGAEKAWSKKLYNHIESILLLRYQKKLPLEPLYACLSTTDVLKFSTTYQLPQVAFVPCFVAWDDVQILPGKGDYCLYHGNMSVAENEEAALWLVKEVFSKISAPLIITGKEISAHLKKFCKNHEHVNLVSDPTIEQIDALVQNAQINVLPSVNSTGVKLKLLHALFRGRHCITNTAGVAGSHLEEAVAIANQPFEWIQMIEQLCKTDFTSDQSGKRKMLLQLYNNKENAHKLSGHLR